MIQRNNPYRSADSSSLKTSLGNAKQIVVSTALATTLLLTFTGCGKDAVEDLQLITDSSQVPDDAVVFDLEDGSYFVDGQRLINFKDNAFRDAFDEEIDYYSVMLEERLSLNEPSSIEELCLFMNLKDLSIRGSDIEDMSIIHNLDDLEYLSISGCDNITDFSFLADSNIEELRLTDMLGLEDLSFLSEMDNLKALTIDNCGSCTIDADVLRSLELTSLDISFMKINDLSFVSEMTNLEELSISSSNIHNIEDLQNLHSLKVLDLGDCLITDATPLYELTNLEEIDLRNNSIDSFDLTKFPNLTKIAVGMNYSLYTEEFLSYCEQHDIETDITQEDVDCMKQVREIVEGMELDGLSVAEKEAKIYSYVLDHMKYDKKGANDGALLADYNNRALYYALQGKGVCATYAAMFDAMCDAAGIEAFYISGYAKTGMFGLSGGPHAWNLVEIDGQYMLCDATWSDSVRDSFDYKVLHAFEDEKSDNYFNVSGKDAEKFMKEHAENANFRTDEINSPRSDETGDIVSINTTEENGEKVSGAVIAGIVTGSVVLVGSSAVGAAVHSAKKKKRRRERLNREAEAVKRNSSSNEYGRYRY